MTRWLAAGIVTIWSVYGVAGDLMQDMSAWETQPFDEIQPSRYSVDAAPEAPVITGRCDNSASLFGLRREIDLRRTPTLHWEWQVDGVYPGIDEQSKSGDDFVARVYAVKDGGLLKWRTRALNYVWASEAAPGTHWPNPFREQAMMIALQQGNARVGEWVAESRNIREDFRRFFDRDVDSIDGIAIMTDCDNHGGQAEVRFRNIRFR
ncbi:MAG: hypothetical protein CMN28_01965 [Salinisphaeraceae bacterium]|nr:hypothetical protein [Salinisphaeraceae bacterium]